MSTIWTHPKRSPSLRTIRLDSCSPGICCLMWWFGTHGLRNRRRCRTWRLRMRTRDSYVWRPEVSAGTPWRQETHGRVGRGSRLFEGGAFPTKITTLTIQRDDALEGLGQHRMTKGWYRSGRVRDLLKSRLISTVVLIWLQRCKDQSRHRRRF